MTKREHDAATKLNYGCFMGAHVTYRLDRGHDYYGRDRLAERAAYRRRTPHIPTLGMASPYRARTEPRRSGACAGASLGSPLTPEERLATYAPSAKRA